MRNNLKTLLCTGIACVLLSFGPTPESSAATGNSKSLYASPADQNIHFRNVIQRIRINRPTLRTFTQNKSVKAIGKTLASSGLLLITPTGVCWSISTPFPGAMKMTREGLATRRPGKPIQVQRAADSVEIEKFVSMMMALFSADEKQLGRVFDFFFTGDDASWTIGFRPSSRSLSRIITAVELSGTRGVEKIVIR